MTAGDQARVDGVDGEIRISHDRVDIEVVVILMYRVAESPWGARSHGVKVADTFRAPSPQVPCIIVVRQAVGHPAEDETVVGIAREQHFDMAVRVDMVYGSVAIIIRPEINFLAVAHIINLILCPIGPEIDVQSAIAADDGTGITKGATERRSIQQRQKCQADNENKD